MEYEVTTVFSMSLTLPTECFFRLVQTLSTKDCKGPQTNMPKNVGSMKTFAVRLWLMFVLYVFWGRRSFIDPICCNSCMVLSMC